MTEILIVDEKGVPQDIEAYKQRIILPDNRKSAIEDSVRRKEAELNEFAEPQGNPEFMSVKRVNQWFQFANIMKEFLVQATYVENLLGPYVLSQKSREQMQRFRDNREALDRRLHVAGGPRPCTNENMYYLEKMMRLGLDTKVLDYEKEAILSLEEDSLERVDIGKFIKMFNRHQRLGLPTDIDPGTKEQIERALGSWHWWCMTGKPDYSLGTLAAAKRAGFTLPSVPSKSLDNWIATWVEQDEEHLSEGLRVDAGDLKRNEKIKSDREGYLVERYIWAMHHLHRLFYGENHVAGRVDFSRSINN